MHYFPDFPLTELRSTLLESLASPHHDIEWSSGPARRWLESQGYAEYVGGAGSGYALTTLGKIAHEIDRVHTYGFSSKLLGGSPIKGGGNRYGTRVRCRCGWREETNEGGAKGKRELRASLKAHHAKVGAAMIANGEVQV
jgi:hypothetical protein